MKKIIIRIINFLFHRVINKVNLINLENKEKNILVNAKNLINNRIYISNNINDYEFSVFSQWGEDGILNYLINHLDIKFKNFVEFGVENYLESNTRFLLQNNNWSGLILDNNKKNIEEIKNHYYYWKFDIDAIHFHITSENINQILKKKLNSNNLGLLSIDVDGNDYWIWKNLNIVDPQIVVIEYNSIFGKKKSVTVPYNPNFDRKEAHYSTLYYGASLKALCKLAETKNLKLVGTNNAGNNAFFVKKNLLNKYVKERTIDECFKFGKFRESRDKKGKLSFITLNEQTKIIENLKVENV
jgi:hypothetical protein